MKVLPRRFADASRLPPKELLRRQIYKLRIQVHKLINSNLDNRKGGVLHIGANEALEAEAYGDRPVVWFEANPELLSGLQQHIAPFPNQRAFCALLGDSRREVDFHIASNRGVSSSLFEFGPYSAGRESLWPDLNLRMQRTIRLEMQTLDALLAQKYIDAAAYDRWVLDVQGAELLVLRGATDSLRHCKIISVEVSTVEVYRGGVQYTELKDYLRPLGFVPLAEPDRLGIQHGDVMFIHRSLGRAPYFRSLLSLFSWAESRSGR
jgi:FkbM family methyltransferase